MDEKTLHVDVEMEPHNTDTTGVLLNRPAPQGGAFLVRERLPRADWDAAKAAGAWYWSRDDLEEFDMFESSPGWRYPLAAMEALIARSYSLLLRGAQVTSIDALRAMFSENAKAAYWQRVEREREEERHRQAAAEVAEKARRAALGAEYEAWKQETLAGLVRTFADPHGDAWEAYIAQVNASPPGADVSYDPGIAWEHVRSFSKDVPGTWYTTGDAWYRAEVDGQTIYRCEYGNASVHYAPQALVDIWCEQDYGRAVRRSGEVSAARWVLDRAGQGCIGDDVADRLIALHGREHYEAIAKQEPSEAK